MSYDLMVFDPEAAPTDRDAFMAWYRDVTRWTEDRAYDAPDGTADCLRAFYDALRERFPPMNGPHAAARERADDPRVTEYTIAARAIYLAFAWSVAEEARRAVIEAAAATGAGFFDVSARAGVIAHDPSDVAALAAAR